MGPTVMEEGEEGRRGGGQQASCLVAKQAGTSKGNWLVVLQENPQVLH